MKEIYNNRTKIEWTEEMIIALKMKFPTEYNKYLAIELGVSVRTLIRKARELKIDKEPDFLEKRRTEISKRATACRPPNPTKGQQGWSVPNSEATRFKPGNISPMAVSQKVRDKVSQSRLKTIEEERYRIREGLDQVTRLKLK